MATRLQAAGVRPISSIVDITNYVLIELGHPMHAFDLAKLAGPEIRVRRALAGEAMTTLDGVERKLDPDMLVIADRDRAQAVAGVMGGAASEVSGATKTRRVRERVLQAGLASGARASAWASRPRPRPDSSVAPTSTLRSSRSQRLAALMDQIGAGRATGPIIDVYPAPRGAGPDRTSAGARLASLLGVEVPDTDVAAHSRSPWTRRDSQPLMAGTSSCQPSASISLREVDLIEEVGTALRLRQTRRDLPRRHGSGAARRIRESRAINWCEPF